MNLHLRSLVAACIAAVAILAAQPAARAADASDALARIKKAGVIRIGVKTTIPNIGYANPANKGALEGFEIDIARGIAKSLLGDANKVQFVPVGTPDRIPKIQQGAVDLIVATLTITSDRMNQIDFSDVYFKAGQTLLTRAGSPIKSARDLGGKTVCTARTSTSETMLRKVAPSARVVLKDTYGACYDLLKRSAVDAMTTDNVILLGFWLHDEKNFTLVPDTFTAEPYGIGMARGSRTLRDAVDEALREIRRNGTYATSYQKWLHQPLPRNYGFWVGMPPDRAAQQQSENAKP